MDSWYLKSSRQHLYQWQIQAPPGKVTMAAPAERTYVLEGPDGSHVAIPYSDTTTVLQAIAELRRVLGPVSSRDAIQLQYAGKALPPNAILASVQHLPGERITYVVRQRVAGEISERSRTTAPAGRSRGLPRRTDIDYSAIEYPADFDRRMGQLREMGLKLGDEPLTDDYYKSALESAFFDVNRASEYLLTICGSPAPVAGPAFTRADRIVLKRIEQRFNVTPDQRVMLYQYFEATGKDEEMTGTLFQAEFGQPAPTPSRADLAPPPRADSEPAPV
jgi:hypothetical protein